jgi:hypothetical protein
MISAQFVLKRRIIAQHLRKIALHSGEVEGGGVLQLLLPTE